MRFLCAIALLYTFNPVLASDSDAVNERIPVRADQMEDHWGIDCNKSWAQLRASDCDGAQALTETLQLCAAIYQPPGSARSKECPDFHGAAEAISGQNCRQLRAVMDAVDRCSQGIESGR